MNRFSIAFVDDVEARYPDLPWSSFEPAQHSPERIAQARRFWSENAFNEYASALAMTQLLDALGRAQIPSGLWALACGFPADEVVHMELCAGVARRAGGGVEIPFEPAALTAALDDALAPVESATLLVVRACCIGEAVALPLLAGNLRAAKQPLARAVLERIVRDETRHARFGWQYLDWAAPALTDAVKARLGRMLGDTLDRVTALAGGDASPDDGAGLGWMSPAEWRALAKTTVEQRLVAPLARYGIVAAA